MFPKELSQTLVAARREEKKKIISVFMFFLPAWGLGSPQ
jgi:hypothetical protein